MDSFEKLDKLIAFWVRNKMPREQIVYAEPELMRRINDWMGSISSKVSGVKFPDNESGVVVSRIQYGGFIINIIDISTLP